MFVKDGAIGSDERYRDSGTRGRRKSVVFFVSSTTCLSGCPTRRVGWLNPDWHVICAPSFKADPARHGCRQSNVSAIDFTRKIIVVAGSGYTGEIKKGMFSVMNFLLPVNTTSCSMHCSSNMGKDGDVAVFFGLSGTGKTTAATPTGH